MNWVWESVFLKVSLSLCITGSQATVEQYQPCIQKETNPSTFWWSGEVLLCCSTRRAAKWVVHNQSDWVSFHFCKLTSVISCAYAYACIVRVNQPSVTNKRDYFNYKPVSQSCTAAKSIKFWWASGHSNLADGMEHCSTGYQVVVWVQKPNVGSFCCGQPFVCQVWLSSGPPGVSSFSYSAWL